MDIGSFLSAVAVALVTWFLGAIIVVGVMQTVKKVIPTLDHAKNWVLTLIMMAVGIGVGFGRFFMAQQLPPEGPIWTSLGIVAVSQICYESIYRGVIKRGVQFADAGEPASGNASSEAGQP